MKSRLFIISILLLVWCGFSNNFSSINILFGLLIATGIHFLVMPQKIAFSLNIHKIFSLIVYILYELIISSLEVAREILRIKPFNEEKFVTIPLDTQHISQITLLTCLISLSPGTLTVDVVDKSIVIHTMFANSEAKIIAYVKKIECYIIEALQYA